MILAQGELLMKERERESEGHVPVNKGKKAILTVKHGIEQGNWFSFSHM